MTMNELKDGECILEDSHLTRIFNRFCGEHLGLDGQLILYICPLKGCLDDTLQDTDTALQAMSPDAQDDYLLLL